MIPFYYDSNSLKDALSYDDIFASLSKRKQGKYYVYTSDVCQFIQDVLFGILNGKSLVLLDGDFSHKELANLGLNENDLSKSYIIGKPRQIKNYTDICRAIDDNLDTVKVGIFTSGTTGLPKKFDHTLRSLLRNIKVSPKHKNDIWAFAYNCTHFAGVQVLLQAVLNTNTIVNVFGENAQKANELIEQYKCNCISATPTYYRNFILTDNKTNELMHNVTFGGEKFSNTLLKKVKQKFPNARIRNIYASTEVGSLLSGKDETFTIPDNMRDLVKISQNCHLLLHRDLVLHTVVDEEWYDTGDIVSMNEDGSFKILSRDSDFINVGGYKVNPLEVEDVIMQVPGVIDTVVYGRDNSVIGKLLVADVVASDDTDFKALKKEITSKIKNELQAYKLPRIIKSVSEIKRSRTGKKVR